MTNQTHELLNPSRNWMIGSGHSLLSVDIKDNLTVGGVLTLGDSSGITFVTHSDLSNVYQSIAANTLQINDISNVITNGNIGNNSGSTIKHHKFNYSGNNFDVSSIIPYIVSDFSYNFATAGDNSKINININLKYLTSCSPNALLYIEAFYSIHNDHHQFAEYTLGTENTSLMYNTLSINDYIDISYNQGTNINFYIKTCMRSIPQASNTNLNTLNIDERPKLFPQLQSGNSFGNNMIIQEFI